MKNLLLEDTKAQDRIVLELLENRIEYLKDFEKVDAEEMVELEQVRIIRARLQALNSAATLTIYTVTIDELPGLSTQVFTTEEAALDNLLDNVPIKKDSPYTKEQLKSLYFSRDGDFCSVLQTVEDEDEEKMVYSLQSHTVN